ncbi:hypothetical protein WIW50_09965 [Flavobacteriaceae bacterium 3-367]|uniref:hypothetical protein n=1 Tax=Eudoraea algarum TaxID=3417568 RepID=UPI00328A3DAC
MIKNTILFLFILLMVSCSGTGKNKEKKELLASEDFNTVTIKDQYSIALPKYMKEAKNLNRDASLQYQNIFKEVYFVVIDEPKQELMEVFKELDEWDESKSVVQNYRDIRLQFLSENVAIEDQTTPKTMKINGLDAEILEIDGKVAPDYELAYTLGFVEGKDHVYMITAWTLKDKKEKLKETFEQAIASFEQL